MLCHIDQVSQFDQLLVQQPVFCIYKFNSNGCRISEHTIKQVQAAMQEYDLQQIYYVDVITAKALSNYITQQTGIDHESPQFLVFQDGTVSAQTSHMHITKEWIEQHI